jgi:hypothetical protein
MDDHHQRERRAERREVGRRNWTACDQDSQRQSLDLWEVDLDLEDKILQNEAKSVLAWLVAGCARQLRSANGTGLDMPQALAQATRDFERRTITSLSSSMRASTSARDAPCRWRR